jgi:hypothetical protein
MQSTSDGYITVRNAKNHEDRIEPVHPQLIERCRIIPAEIHAVSPDDEYFFMIRPGLTMPLVNVYRNFHDAAFQILLDDVCYTPVMDLSMQKIHKQFMAQGVKVFWEIYHHNLRVALLCVLFYSFTFRIACCALRPGR